MKRALSQAVLAVALSASFLSAQTTSAPTPTPHSPAQMAANRVTRLTKLLDLTSAQQTTANGIFATEATAVAGLAASSRAAQSVLQAAVLRNDSAAITSAAGQIGSLTTQRVLAQATANAAFYAILLPDQQSKYATLEPLGVGGPGGGRFAARRRG